MTGLLAPQNARREELASVVKFLCVGVAGYSLSLALFVLFHEELGIDYRISAALGNGVSFALNFFVNRRWTFQAHCAPLGPQAIRFATVATLATLANVAIVHVLVETGGLPALGAEALAVVAATPVSYLGNRLWTFHGSRRGRCGGRPLQAPAGAGDCEPMSAIATHVPGAPPDPAPPRRGGEVSRGLIRSMRPKQFVKNLLVFAAPIAGGVLDDGPVLVNVTLAFVAFCLVSAATYLLNDVGDVAQDRVHPTKRHRPVAAGVIGIRLALAASLILLAGGLSVAFLVNWQLGATVAGYKVVTTAYTYRLKDLPVFDIAVVASGFIVRAVAGGVAADIPLSRWFLIVACFGSLFMVAGKRQGELMHIGDASTRPALAEYSLEYLRFVWTMSAAVAVGAYCLWAFEHPASDSGVPWWGLSIAPFVIALMRYALLVERGEASSPEEVVLGDRTLQLLGAAWLGLFVCSVYLG